jgi:hypothetical protein
MFVLSTHCLLIFLLNAANKPYHWQPL